MVQRAGREIWAGVFAETKCSQKMGLLMRLNLRVILVAARRFRDVSQTHKARGRQEANLLGVGQIRQDGERAASPGCFLPGRVRARDKISDAT